jgi:hypothetical protein
MRTKGIKWGYHQYKKIAWRLLILLRKSGRGT